MCWFPYKLLCTALWYPEIKCYEEDYSLLCSVFCGIQRKRSCDIERLDELRNIIAQEHTQLYLFRHRLNSGSAKIYTERLIINKGKYDEWRKAQTFKRHGTECCNEPYLAFSTFAGFPNMYCNWFSYSFIAKYKHSLWTL